jgi:PAS domain S-box-containing protein
MVAFAGYPLVVDDHLVGVWAMFARHELSEATLRAMESVARGIALGIERYHAEQTIRREREWLRVTLASIGDAVIATDEHGRVKFLNPAAEGLTGWSPAEAAGETIGRVFAIINEISRQPAENPVDLVLREGVTVGLANHTVVIARDGTETAIEDSAAPIRDADGGVVGVVMVFQDATERRKHEAALREGERQFRTLAESIPQLVWMARPDGHIYWYNRRWYDYTGTTPHDMEGWGWMKVHDPAILPGVMEAWGQSIATGQPFDRVFPLLGADGQYRPFLTRVMPVLDEDGRIAQWFGTNTDIADRQRIEDELKLAKEEAEAANAAKTQFLAVLSHELRTPLNPILLAVSSMLERPTPPDDIRSNLEMIRQNVNLQSRLIDDLLDVMRIVRGKMPLHWEVVDAHVLIGHSVGICRSEVFGKGLKLTLALEADRHHINADPVRLQQVFWNLIKNAVKFTPSGGSIAIRSRNEADADDLEDRLIIEVVDTGIGIEPDVVDRIFDPFQQGETSITRRFGGLGLGLAISKGIVEGHGGILKAKSPGKDQGTSFRLELRALPDPKPDEPSQSPPRPSAFDYNSSMAPLKILLVEDEQATSRLMARLLRRLGHVVETAGTIADAVEKERSGDFNLIVSDIGLPDGSGLELMKKVVARRGHVPAIALTGYGMEEDIQRSREAGFIAHMTKPIDFTKLEAMIRQVAS